MDAKHKPTRRFFATNAAHKRHLKAVAKISADQETESAAIRASFPRHNVFVPGDDFIATFAASRAKRAAFWDVGTATRRNLRREMKRQKRRDN